MTRTHSENALEQIKSGGKTMLALGSADVYWDAEDILKKYPQVKNRAKIVDEGRRGKRIYVKLDDIPILTRLLKHGIEISYIPTNEFVAWILDKENENG